MKGDFTRFTFDRRKHYSGIRMQQGRVQLDSDWNELVDIQSYRMRIESEDFIGPSGAPKLAAGFSVQAAMNGKDLSISPGRMYVDGTLCENEAEVLLMKQVDLPGYALPTEDGLYLAYLEVWQRHITALEDPALREVGLGGADTATRVKTVWQVRLFRVGDVGMAANASTEFPKWNTEVAPSTGKLQAHVEPTATSQLRTGLYRVEVHRIDSSGTIVFKWSRDDASIAARCMSQLGNELTVEGIGGTGPLDLSPGQWVELTDDSHELQNRPGTLVQLLDVEGGTLTFDPATATAPMVYEDFAGNPIVRRWDSPGAVKVDPAAAPSVLLEDGLEVEFGPGTYRVGDYWLIPARSFTGDIEWPRDGSGPEALAPHGIQRRYSRLALVELEAGTFTVREDCRFVFSSLTDLKELTAVRAAVNAPDGAIHVDVDGNVDIGQSLRIGAADVMHEIRALKIEVQRLRERPTVPIGGIIAWYPESWDPLDVPQGFAICDGSAITQGPQAGRLTPDLRDRFLRGAAAGRQGSTGGGDTISFSHSHHMAHAHYFDTWTYYGTRVDAVVLGNGHDPRNHHAYITGAANLWWTWGDYARPRVSAWTGGSQTRTSEETVHMTTVPSYFGVIYIMRIA